MPLFKRAAPSPTTPLTELFTTAKSKSSWEHGDAPSTPPSTHPTSPSHLRQPSLNSTTSWDVSTFPETPYLYPTERNGNWCNTTLDVFKHSGTPICSAHEALSWPHIHTKLTSTVESASEGIQDSLNRAFEGHDVPAIHYKVMSLVPSISMPTLRQVCQSMDCLTDKAQSLLQRRRSMVFVDEELAGDHLAFAYHMGAKARHALVNQGICKVWQMDATRETVQWRSELEAALSRLYLAEKESFSVEQLFSMTPIWTGDVFSKTWKLRLDTGMVEIVVDGDNDEYEEQRVCLQVTFRLPESAGRVRVEDVEREAVDDEDWMTVQ